MGFNELRKSYEEFESIGILRKAAKAAKERGDVLKGKMSTKASEIEESYSPVCVKISNRTKSNYLANGCN